MDPRRERRKKEPDFGRPHIYIRNTFCLRCRKPCDGVASYATTRKFVCLISCHGETCRVIAKLDDLGHALFNGERVEVFGDPLPELESKTAPLAIEAGPLMLPERAIERELERSRNPLALPCAPEPLPASRTPEDSSPCS